MPFYMALGMLTGESRGSNGLTLPVYEPWPGVVSHETNGDIIALATDAYNITENGVVIVRHVSSSTPDHVEVMLG